jgi:hypothetical protein
VARRPALLQHDPAQAGAVVVEQRGGAHGAGDDDGVVGQLRGGRDEIAPDELVKEPVGEVVEIVQALAQIGVGLAQQAGAGVGLHALHGGLGGEAGEHRLAHPAQPALVVREHAHGLQHLAMLAAVALVAALDQRVDRGAHGLDRGLEPSDLRLRVLGDEVLHHDARLVQDDVAEAHPLRQGDALQVERAAQRDVGAGLRQGLELARGDHLRQHHRRGLEGLDLLFRVGAHRAVLHDEDAERVARAQDRDAEEAVIDLLARLRLVGEGGVRLRVRERERLGLARDQADEALPRPHRRQVDGGAVEAFRGVELERLVGAQDIDRAHLGHHVGRDQHDDLVEPVLRADRLRHDLAELAEQNARTAGSTPHRQGHISFGGRAHGPAGSMRAKRARAAFVASVLRPRPTRIASGACARQARCRPRRSASRT